jgi:hypothetical protein
MEHMVLAFDGLAKQWGDAFVNWDQLHNSLCKSAHYYHPLAQVWAVLMKETKGLVFCPQCREASDSADTMAAGKGFAYEMDAKHPLRNVPERQIEA